MGKCFRTVYFDAQVYLDAEKAKVDFNGVCNQAIKEATSGSTAGETLKADAEKEKDNQLMMRLSTPKNSQDLLKWKRAVAFYSQKYGINSEEVMRRFQ